MIIENDFQPTGNFRGLNWYHFFFRTNSNFLYQKKITLMKPITLADFFILLEKKIVSYADFEQPILV